MKLSRPVIALISAAILLLLGSAFFLLQPPGEAERQAAMAEMIKSYGAGPEGAPFPLAYNTDDLDEEVAREGILNAVRAGKVNLPHELRKLRAECPRDATPADCNQSIIDYLYNLPPPDNEKLVQLFQTYIKYETERTRLSGAPGMGRIEKYEALKRKRREVFGADADLIFGLEEANFAYQDVLRRFQSDEFAELTPDDRLRKLHNMRQDLFGDYFETLKEREPEGMKYGLELLVRQTDLKQMPEAQQDATIRKLRVKYFGEERAEQMTAAETEERAKMSAATAKVDEFLQAEARVNADPDLNETQKREKIEELRAEIIGSGE